VGKVIVVTGALSGFGALTARALADSENMVYAAIRNIGGRNAKAVAEEMAYAFQRHVELRVVEIDVISVAPVEAAVAQIVEEGRAS